MTFNLVSQVINYLKTIEEYVSFLETYLDCSAYDDFDRAYASFFEDFKNFVWQTYAVNEGGLKKLIEEFGEIEVPVESSMISFCLEGLKQHTSALSGSANERRRIYGRYLQKCLGIENLAFLDQLNRRQWTIFENCVFDVKDAKQLFACLEANNIDV